MNHYLQGMGTSICGQCVIAMLTGTPLYDVLEALGSARTYPRDFQRGCKRWGLKIAPRSSEAIEGKGPEGQPCAAYIQLTVDGRKIQHWLAWDGEKFLDPRGGTHPWLPESWNPRLYLVI